MLLSHFTKVSTQIVEKKYLLQALQSLGWAYREGRASVPDYQGQQLPVDICATVPGMARSIGFKESNGRYEVVADWWNMGMTEQQFVNTVSQRYAYMAVHEKLQEQGFALENQESRTDGSIRMVMKRKVKVRARS